MSGIVAIVRLDGAPADRALAESLTASLRFRGPDGNAVWSEGAAALGHTLLRLTPDDAAQPLRLGDCVIAADARLDARDELLAKLGAHPSESDAALIVHAYRQWGEACVEHLAGDFAFALWDLAERRLFCARDRFGIRPLFYAQLDDALIVTNTLSLLVGLAPRILNRDAIADFLLFGFNRDESATTFASIRRVAPAHRLVAERGGLRVTRYWSLPTPAEPRRIDERDAVEQFRELLTRAVRDRARGDSVVLSLSGGVDSTTVAAMLMRTPPRHVHAFTTVWDARIPDEERRWSSLAAQHLGIPIEHQVVDDFLPFDGWDDPLARGLEPTDDPFSAILLDFTARAATKGRVALTGQGGDAAFYTSHAYFFDLLRRGRWLRLVRDAAHYAWTRHRRPPLLFRSQLKLAIGRPSWQPDFPPWIEPTFARETNARERFDAHFTARHERLHPFRNEAARLATRPIWSTIFEQYDAGSTRQPLAFTTPYFDVRVIDFLFSLPPMPHFADKDLARRSTAGLLPDSVRFRPKTPLAGDVTRDLFRAQTERWLVFVAQATELDGWVDRRILTDEIRSRRADGYRTYQQVIAVSLAAWLRGAAP